MYNMASGGGAVAARRVHTPEVGGSSPSPAPMLPTSFRSDGRNPASVSAKGKATLILRPVIATTGLFCLIVQWQDASF